MVGVEMPLCSRVAGELDIQTPAVRMSADDGRGFLFLIGAGDLEGEGSFYQYRSQEGKVRR